MSADAGPVIRIDPEVQQARLDSARAPWRDQSECRKPDILAIKPPVDFHPVREADAWPAIAVCRQCSVRSECLEAAILCDERFGVWGGKTERQRVELVKGTRRRPIKVRNNSSEGQS